ncbi:hypothetical protein RYX36_018188 [Vicia faba]
MTTQTIKRKPLFVKAGELKPGTSGHTLTMKVVSSSSVKTVPSRGGRSSVIASRPSRIAECIVGDETAVIIFIARNKQDIRLQHARSWKWTLCKLYGRFLWPFCMKYGKLIADLLTK